jgi:GntR family transcriptional regulator
MRARAWFPSRAVTESHVDPVFGAGWTVTRDSDLPAYAQIERRLAGLIADGELAPGDRLPSERDLAAKVGVSRLTARAALASLAQRGLVDRGVGRRGTFVSQPKMTYDLRDFTGFTEMARRHGLEAGARVLAAEQVPAPDNVADALLLAPVDEVYRLVRLRSAGGEPLTLEHSWIPVGPFPGLLQCDITHSLYAVMKDSYDRAPVRARERLEANIALDDQARALGVSPGAPLMLVERVAYSADGTPVEFARDYHRGDRAHFVAELTTRVN